MLATANTSKSTDSDDAGTMPALDALPLEIFHHVAGYLPPGSIGALASVSRAICAQVYSDGPYLWRELALRRYDPVRETDGMDWKYIYQSRIWAEMILQRDDITAFLQEKLAEDEDRPAWKISGQILLATIRDMIVENDTKNADYLVPNTLVDCLRREKDHSQLSAMVQIFLSPISKFNPQLSRSMFSAAQRAVYVSNQNPLFGTNRTPNFLVILSIIKFFQHHLDHMRNHIAPVTRDALTWHNAGYPGAFAFQPGPPVTRHEFDDDPSKVEGNWIGLYSYLGWADFEALRDGNPVVLEANRAGHLRDYLGGPQRLRIRLPRTKDGSIVGRDSPGGIVINGDGNNGGSFTFNGRLRKVYLPVDVVGRDMHLYWRLTFVKTYANGENSWTRWIYDGIYCPGVGILGRWQDGTEPPGRGVTGPFWLWPSVRDATNPLEDSFGLHHFADSPGASSEAASDDMF